MNGLFFCTYLHAFDDCYHYDKDQRGIGRREAWQFYGIQKRRRWASNGDIQSVDAGLQFTVDGALNSGDLAPNGKKEADLYFQVPKDDAELTLHYESSIWSDKTINIKL